MGEGDSQLERLSRSGRLSVALVGFTLLISSLNLLPTKTWVQELNTGLSLHYSVLHVLGLVVLAVFRKRIGATVFASFVFLSFLLLSLTILKIRPLIFSSFEPQTVKIEQERSEVLSVLYGNNLSSELEEFKRELNRLDPDLVLLLQMSSAALSELNLQAIYEHHRELKQDDSFGIAIYSRHELGVFDHYLGEGVPPYIYSTVLLPEVGELVVSLVQSFPPFSTEAFQRNKLIFRRVATRLRHEERDVLAVGDLHSTIFSNAYGMFRKGARLRDAAEGRGVHFTKRGLLPLAWFGVDHIFYRGRIRVEDFRVLPGMHSEHSLLYSKLRLARLDQSLQDAAVH